MLTERDGLEKNLGQDLTWMDCWKIACGHSLTSMIINDLDIKGIIITPDKAHAPLIVHSNAMLSLAIMAQCFEPIARRYA